MHGLDARALEQRLVGHGLQRDDAAAAQALVGGDEHLAAAVLDAVAQRVGREAAEDDGVDRADARAGEHRDGELGDHRHVDGDAVALLDAVLLEHVGEAADLVVERLVRVDLAAALVGLPDDGGLVAAPVGQVTVEAVVGDVGLAADEPLDLGRLELPLEDLVPRLVPVDELARPCRPRSPRDPRRSGRTSSWYCSIELIQAFSLTHSGGWMTRPTLLTESKPVDSSVMTASLSSRSMVRESSPPRSRVPQVPS